MDRFNKLANLHSVFFKKAEGVLPKQLRGLEDFTGPKGYLSRKGLPIPSKSTGASTAVPANIPVRSGQVQLGPVSADPRIPENRLPPGPDLLTYYRNYYSK